MSVRTTLLYTSFFVAICYITAEPVSFINKCKPGDSKCIKESVIIAIPPFSQGLKEYGVEPVDPLHISKSDASTPGLKLIVTDAVVTGLKDCRVKKFTHNTQKNAFSLKVQCDVNLDGNYEMLGQLLILRMEGKGPVHVKLRKIELIIDVSLDDKVKNGIKYWHIKSFKHSFKLKDKSDVVFENLFPGNEVLGRAARELIANSGNDIINEVGHPVIESVVSELAKTVNKFFSSVPLDDLFDNQ